jgi:spoIIIJ-associated protein
MINVYKYSGNNEEECRLKCLEELDVYDNEIIYNEYQEEDLYKMDVVKKDDIKKFINEYLSNILKEMNITSKIDIEELDNVFKVKMYSDKNSLLIGKDGRTLASLQTLLRQTISNSINFNIKINLDASNYKAKKEQYFERDIKKILNEVMTTKSETKLDPMNSYQRRIVHSLASDYYNLETESFGEEPERYVVIKYIEK